jgi:hypothetical protein
MNWNTGIQFQKMAGFFIFNHALAGFLSTLPGFLSSGYRFFAVLKWTKLETDCLPIYKAGIYVYTAFFVGKKATLFLKIFVLLIRDWNACH